MTEQSPASPQTDEAALEEIRGALDKTLFVEAGAGTGKTSALVDRVVALVLGGRAIDRIAAITFTEKAAAELKDRVRQGLEACLHDRPEARTRIEEALASLDRARISTIHSFCQDLLHHFAAEAGVDPSFEVQDEVAADRRFSERWRAFVEGLSSDDDAAGAIDRVLGLGMTTGHLEELARGLAARAEIVPGVHLVPAVPPPDWGPVVECIRRLQEAVPSDIQESDELGLEVKKLESLLDELESNPRDREVILGAATDLPDRKYGQCGDRAAWGAALNGARSACTEVRDRLGVIASACRAEALQALMPLVERFVKEDAQARGRDGLMTYDDLILRVRDLLQMSSDACRAFRERYDALLIDEFQDTDPLQVDMAIAFATDPDTGAVEPGRLFLVGDPKQSIYRFRRADMAVYSRTREALREAGAGMPILRRNRRSRPVVLKWVNRVFRGLIGTGTEPAVQPEYQDIYPSRDGDLRGAGVGCFGGEIDGKNARQIRTMESQDVATCCRSMVADGWEVMDRTTRATRPASYRDIAILIPARTVLTALERSLAEAGIPYRVEGGSLIFRTQEVRDLLNCLTAIDDPADEVAIVGALRSPAFACSDLDIARFVSGGGKINYLRSDVSAGDGRVAEGLRTLRRFHEQRRDGSLAALVEAFVTDRALAETGILDRGDRNSFRRMRYVVERARVFEANGPESLRALVQWLEGRSQEQMLDYEGAGLDDDEDAVRVLTLHGAKGLEFPIVIMAGMGTSANTRTGTYLVDRSDDSVAIQVGYKNAKFALGNVSGLDQAEKRHIQAEFTRMLYVGATRARDHLVFSLYRKRGFIQAAAALLEGAGATQGVERLAPAPPVAAQPGRFEGVTVDEPSAGTAEELEEQRRALVQSSRTEVYTSATRLGRKAEGKEAAEDDTEPWSRGRAGTRLGRAVHAAIQSLPLDADETMIEAFSRAQSVAEAIPERAKEVERLVRAALSSGAAARARAAPRALREVPFAVTMDGTIVEGFVDMLVEGPEGLEIIDWKTDRVGESEVQARLAEYELQAGLYVLGIERATGRRVNSVTYVFVAAGREESPGDPSALARSAEDRVLASGGLPPQS